MDNKTASPNILDLSETGFWFCQCCQHVTTYMESKQGYNVCSKCSSPRIKWCPPISEQGGEIKDQKALP
jgi:hypothetical protein